MSTLDMPAEDHEMRHRAPVDDVGEHLPVVPEELRESPDGLPAKSACRWCGRRTDTAGRFGGAMRVPDGEAVPADAVNVRRVRVRMPAAEAAMRQQGVGAMQATLMAGPVVQEFTVPVWRVCDECESTAVTDEPLRLLSALLQTPLPRNPVHLAVADKHAPAPYWRTPGARPSDSGPGRRWGHIDQAAVDAARVALQEFQGAGGVPSPTGQPCGICGRSNSHYGWAESPWLPPVEYGHRVKRFPVCGGVRRVHRPELPAYNRWQSVRTGCEVLLTGSRNGVLAPLHELAWTAAQKAGVEMPSSTWWFVSDFGRLLAFTHPDYGNNCSREPWWHVADVPVPPPPPEVALAARLDRLEAEAKR